MRKLIVLLSIVIAGCSSEPSGPDVSKIPVDIRLQRFEQAFFRLDTNRMEATLPQLYNQFPQFTSFFIQQILHVQPNSPELKQIVSTYQPINDSIQQKYRNLSWLQKDLKKAFQHVLHYYPSYKVPTVITFLATFDAPGVILTPSYLGIGLHQYAGKKFSVYGDPQLQEMYPTYISRRFDKEYMTANCMKAIVNDLYADSSAGRPLIEQMIEKGKQWYLLDHFVPNEPDSVKTGYQQKQLDWCNRNEGNIWGYFTSNVDIYSIDPTVVQDFIGEGPFTRGMPEGFSPGNLGQWVGWQIVKKFAEKNDQIALQQVLSTPAATIFQESKYKPK
jgi:hypothetical protein